MLKKGDKVFLFKVKEKPELKNTSKLNVMLDYSTFNESGEGDVEKHIKWEENYLEMYDLTSVTIDSIINGRAVVKEIDGEWFNIWRFCDKNGNRLINTTEEYDKYKDILIL